MASQMSGPQAPLAPELVFGIVSPIGVDRASTVRELTKALEKFEYHVHYIKVSDIIEKMAMTLGYGGLVSSPSLARVESYIGCGNYIRENLGGSTLAAMAVAEVAAKRIDHDRKTGRRYEKSAYIIDQIKSEDELSLLRDIYGALFFQISIYSSRDIRVDNLARTFAHDHKQGDRNQFRSDAEKIVNRDEDEQLPYGQRVGKIFQKADVVLSADQIDDLNKIQQQIKRFIGLVFGRNSYSPNRMEYGMYVANAAALQSLDLSRQVGAAIFRQSGEIASLGTNEVPRGGGGTYWSGDELDAREYKLSRDSNDLRKTELLNEVLEIALGKAYSLSSEQQKKLSDSQFMDALEYGRIVHAEMCAITDAARLGVPIRDGVLYCTTFPCHMCSKHIVASGISRVVFLEPYPKSLAANLHSDSVKIEGTTRGRYVKFPFVEYVPFFGITPRRYSELFSRNKRKNSTGEFQWYRDNEARPIIHSIGPWYANAEVEVIEAIKQRINASVRRCSL